MRILNINNKSRKCLALIVVSLFYSLQLFAAPEDHGRWYSLDDDSSSSSMSSIGYILGGVILAFLSYTMLRVDDDKKSPTGFYIFGLIGGIILIIVGFSKCGG